MTKKRQTSIISSNPNAHSDTTSKENDIKGSFSSSPLNVSSPSSSSAQPIAKTQISVLKNASSSSTTTASGVSKSTKVSTFMKKDSSGVNKKKILRENVTAASALSNQHIHSQYHQIPHKKIRVSSIVASNSNNSNVVVATEKESFDSELPCCSRSIPAFSIYSKAPSSPSSGSSSSSNSGQVKITSFMPMKKPSVVKYSKPSGAGKKLRSESLMTTDASAPTFQALSEKIIKKKKRLLTKSESGTLKRKKSRSQKPLV